MSTYTQWRTALERGDIKRITWVCGDQPVLVNEVVEATRGALRVTSTDYAALTAGDDPDADIWAAAGQYPLSPDATRLVVVRHAERITAWGPLTTWLACARYLPHTYLLFVADQPDFADRDGRRPAHLEAIRTRGRLVRCAMPNEADAIAWARRRGPVTDDSARHLLTRCGGDLAAAAAVLDKLALFPPGAGRTTIDALVQPGPAASFADLLITLDRPAALRRTGHLDNRAAIAAFGLLDTRLDVLAALWRANAAGLPPREITGVNPYLVRAYLPYAAAYDARRCAYDRRVLALCDQALRSGARTGVLETLVALW